MPDIYGYERVEPTAEELAAWLAKHSDRWWPSVHRVQRGDCGERLWGSGLGIGSHDRKHARRDRAAREATEAHPLATEAVTLYFAWHAPGHDHQVPMVVDVFTLQDGWRRCPRPYRQLTAGVVQELAAAGVRAVGLAAYCRLADFTLVPTGPISSAYLT